MNDASITKLDTTVTIVIAAYNRPEYLESALESALSQTFCVNEIIVVDDCSQVDLRPVIEKFSSANILYFKKEKNMGVSNSRNIGASLATSTWIAFLDDDDVFFEQKIATQLKHIQATENCVASLCNYIYLETNKIKKSIKTGVILANQLRQGNLFCGASGLIVRKDIFDKELCDEALNIGEDWDLFIRLLKHGALHYTATPLFFYRRGTHDSLTKKAREVGLEKLEPRMRSSVKQKDWLGKKYFNLRVAETILAYFWDKDNKYKWLFKSIELAGIKATLIVIAKKIFVKTSVKFRSE